MSTLSVQIDDWSDFLRDVESAGVNAEPLVKGALFNSATRTQRNIRQRANSHHKTGNMEASILVSMDYPSAMVTSESPQGLFIEYGTRPHDIVPTGKKALFWKGALNPYKTVHHPGTKADPFFTKGTDDSQDYIDSQFIRVAERLINVMAGHK